MPVLLKEYMVMPHGNIILLAVNHYSVVRNAKRTKIVTCRFNTITDNKNLFRAIPVFVSRECFFKLRTSGVI